MTSARNYYKALQGLPKPIKGLDPKKKAATVQPGVVTLIGLFPLDRTGTVQFACPKYNSMNVYYPKLG